MIGHVAHARGHAQNVGLDLTIVSTEAPYFENTHALELYLAQNVNMLVLGYV
jgi:hypothetical protein